MNTTGPSTGRVGLAIMEVLVLILVGTVTVGGLYRIVRDDIRKSRRADKVAQETSETETGGELPIIPIQQEADKCTSSTRLPHHF